MTASPAPDRLHALDSLRGFAMFLGIVLHAGLSFAVQPPAFWPVRDRAAMPVADVCLLAVHDFRMQLFFLLAGFFGCLLYQRYGLRGLARNRVQRIAVPFVLSLLLIVPTIQLAGLCAEIENVRAGDVRGTPSPARAAVAGLVAANPDVGTARLMWDRVRSGATVERLPLYHLWFLYYLLLYVVAVAALAPLLGRLTGTALLARVDAAFRWVADGRGRVLVPATLTFPLMVPMNWVVDTPNRWSPEWHVVGYYGAFVAFGWMLYRHRDLVPAFGRWWRGHLVVANLVALPLMVALVVSGAEAEKGGDAAAPGLKLAASAASVLYTWLMISGLWGAFLRLFARGSAWARYLADAAYWCYLASITPTIVFQFVVRDWPLPGALKCGFVVLATMAVLLLSYEWCVRYTAVGAILNGRKYRPATAAAVPATEEAVAQAAIR